VQDTAATRVHFVHIMKTGGTSLVNLARERLGAQACWPPVAEGGGGIYGDVDRLRALTPQQWEPLRFVSGHHPFAATEISQATVTMTVLRDPVDRAISQLRQRRRVDPAVADASLDEIYDDVWKRAMFISDYQVRQFAKTADDDLFHLAGLEIDDAAMARARANLARVDVLGLFDRYDEFAAEAVAAFGWDAVPFPRWRVSPDADVESVELRARIADDNAADVAFYDWAVGHHRARTTGWSRGDAGP
jgi:hypothetical protein